MKTNRTQLTKTQAIKILIQDGKESKHLPKYGYIELKNGNRLHGYNFRSGAEYWLQIVA